MPSDGHDPREMTATDRAIAASKLREAGKIVAEFLHDDRDRTDCLRRIGIAVATLVEDAGSATCRRCNRAFTFDAVRFRSLGFDLPRHCFTCRQARRHERQSAGAASAVPPRGDTR
jgi:hypothetical protein